MTIQLRTRPMFAALLLCGTAAEAAPARLLGTSPLLMQMAQATTDPTAPAVPDSSGAASPGLSPNAAGVSLSGSVPPKPPGPTALPAAPAPPPSVLGGTTRNNAGALPSLAQPYGAGGPAPSTGIGTGGLQTGAAPIYGGTTRDPGSLQGNLSPSGMPMPIGGPINGTANAYETPPGSAYGGAGIGTGRDSLGRSGSGSTLPPQGSTATTNLQPLGGVPTTRDQLGTTGGFGGYNQQGVYNGTALQTGGNGYGPASSYATVGRPTGGLLSTNVDATGPLRPYIPLNTGPIGHPNSGYGIPNGSRPSHIDGRGIQRMN
ncbi:hypothetical protein P7D22_05365 [Lichenihabitans sp. Uapishka_5]|uniref:hypothetical protein n=1 Tax=Lichenihabitans sp. Uapishka_5 TaxID=3037302 RepID=UPI0029E820AE|nr:hypothetical protein [Lichenihabitans sp. Uapishka_5]MDX7950606.1 hypothetical protein [Lichenihabitans sp. Uapishka_5]